METDKDKEGDAFAASAAAAAATATPSSQSAAQLPTPTNPRVSSPAPSTTSSTGRPPYMPQFSAATQMILKRLNSKPGSLSSALSSASSVTNKTSIEKSAFDDAKRRLVMTMNTSLTMPMPAPMVKATPPSKTLKPSTSATLHMPMNDAFNLRMPAPAPAPGSVKPQPMAKQPTQKAPAPKAKGKRQRGTKRKRGKNDDEDTSSSLSDLSDEEGITVATTASAKETQAVHTMTKSGRQVQKPSQYNPSQQTAAQKRKNYGKRTPEQALCKVCTRGLSPAKNQIVFCDGCNCCWHQLCHEPYIDDDFVSNQSRSWFCRGCVAKREKHLAKKIKLDTHKGVSWSAKSTEQVSLTISSTYSIAPI